MLTVLEIRKYKAKKPVDSKIVTSRCVLTELRGGQLPLVSFVNIPNATYEGGISWSNQPLQHSPKPAYRLEFQILMGWSESSDCNGFSRSYRGEYLVSSFSPPGRSGSAVFRIIWIASSELLLLPLLHASSSNPSCIPPLRKSTYQEPTAIWLCDPSLNLQSLLALWDINYRFKRLDCGHTWEQLLSLLHLTCSLLFHASLQVAMLGRKCSALVPGAELTVTVMAVTFNYKLWSQGYCWGINVWELFCQWQGSIF